MTDTPKPKQAREWPGNDIARLTEDDRILHDHLCELLSDTASENDVCMASVGIWGALSVMRDKMNLLLIETDACRTRIKDQAEALERGYALGIEFNEVAKERDHWRAMAEKLAAALNHYGSKLASTGQVARDAIKEFDAGKNG